MKLTRADVRWYRRTGCLPMPWWEQLLATAVMLAVLLVLTGCSNSVPDAKPTGDTGRVAGALGDAGTANTAAAAAGADVDTKTAKRDGEILADANAAAHANESNPPGVPKEQVDSHLDVLRARLKGAVENAEARASAAERDKLIEQGKSAEARAATAAAVAKAEANASEIAVAKDAEKKAQDALTAAITKAQTDTAALQGQLDQNKKANDTLVAGKDKEIGTLQKQITDLQEKWSSNIQLWTARVLVGFGILVVVAGAAIVWLSGLPALGKAAGIAVSGLLLIGAGLIVGHRYFLPVAGTALGLLIVAGIWYLCHLRRTNEIAKGSMATIQDVKDAAAAGSDKARIAAEELKESLLYRFPRTPDGDASTIEKEIDRRLVAEGLNARAA